METMNRQLLDSDKLEENINVFLTEEVTNTKLINKISLDFAEKGLPNIVPKRLFENTMEWKDVTEDCKIAFLISAYNYFLSLKTSDKKNELHVLNIKPTLYFNENKIKYNNMLKPEEHVVENTLVFPNTIKINDNEFITYRTAQQIWKQKADGNLSYIKGVQRASKRIVLPNGKEYLRENYNANGIKQLENRFMNNDILTTTVTFTIIKNEGKTPLCDFQSYKDCPNVGDFIFTPISDMDSPNYAEMNLADGAHRVNALKNAYEKDNSIECGLMVAIKIITLAEAKQFISDTFQANETDREYINTLDNSIENKYINELISKCIFKNNTAVTKQDEKSKLLYANFKYMKETIQLMNVDLTKSELMVKSQARTVGTIIQHIIDVIIDDFGSIEEVRNNSCLLSQKMSIAYVMAGEYLSTKTEDDILKLAKLFIRKKDEIEKILRDKKVSSIFENLKQFLQEENINV